MFFGWQLEHIVFMCSAIQSYISYWPNSVSFTCVALFDVSALERVNAVCTQMQHGNSELDWNEEGQRSIYKKIADRDRGGLRCWREHNIGVIRQAQPHCKVVSSHSISLISFDFFLSTYKFKSFEGEEKWCPWEKKKERDWEGKQTAPAFLDVRPHSYRLILPELGGGADSGKDSV